MTDRRKAILVEAARDLAEMQEGSDAGWGLWYDWLDTVVRRVEREAGEGEESAGAVYEVQVVHRGIFDQDFYGVPLGSSRQPHPHLRLGDAVRITKVEEVT